MIPSVRLLAVAGFLCLTPLGCAQLPPLTGYGTLPQDLAHQRRALNEYDPFPEDRTAPPIDGARPPGFEHPVSEPERVRRKPWLVE